MDNLEMIKTIVAFLCFCWAMFNLLMWISRDIKTGDIWAEYVPEDEWEEE